QLAVDVEAMEAGSRWSVGQPRVRPTGTVANYDLVYPQSVSPPMIDTSSAIRLSNPRSRDVICLNMLFNIAFRHFVWVEGRQVRREKLLPLLDFRLKKVFVQFLAKDMANFYGKKSLGHLREDNFMVNR